MKMSAAMERANLDFGNHHPKPQPPKPYGQGTRTAPKPELLPGQQYAGGGIFHERGTFQHKGWHLRHHGDKSMWFTVPPENGEIPEALNCAWSEPEIWKKAVDRYLAEQAAETPETLR